MEEVGMVSNNFNFHEFKSKTSLVENLSQEIIKGLSHGIEKKGYSTLVLSGGSTPKKLFRTLSQVDFHWEKVRITLVDERWVDVKSAQSNEKLIRDNLLINHAQKATFFPLKRAEKFAKESLIPLNEDLKKLFFELDVVILGMGLDAHTASFFPDTEELSFALNSTDLVCATTATVEPKERITLTRNHLLRAQNLLLHIEGEEKKELFLKASQSNDISHMPIVAMMGQKTPLLEVYYAD